MECRPFPKELRALTERALASEEGEDVRLFICDPISGRELLLFIKQGYTFGIMRTWTLRGICAASDYDEQMELNGAIEKWLGVEIE